MAISFIFQFSRTKTASRVVIVRATLRSN